MVIYKPLFINILRILLLYLIGYILASHYRPFQNSLGFFDFGLSDSGLGFIHIVITYFVLSPPYHNQVQAKKVGLLILFIYLSQEVFCYFFPGLIGTFDFKDLIYYVFGFLFIYFFDVKSRRVI